MIAGPNPKGKTDKKIAISASIEEGRAASKSAH
jgi:hypothetical protein